MDPFIQSSRGRVISGLIRNGLVAMFCLFIFSFLGFISQNQSDYSVLQSSLKDYLIITGSLILISEFTLFFDDRVQGIFSRNEKSVWVLVGKILLGQLGYFVVFCILIIYYKEYLISNRMNTFFVVFGALYILMFDLFVLTRSYSRRLVREREKNMQLKEDKMGAELNALQNQVNPHFLFNSLNVLISEIYLDQERAVTYTQHLSDIYRYILKSTDHYTVPLKEELEFLESYVYLQEIKYEDAFQIQFDVDVHVMQCEIPVLALQLLVENAIKHNAILKEKPLKIDILYNGKQLIVRNSLNYKKVVDKEGIGLRNLDRRYKLLIGKHIEVCQSEEDFCVILPLIDRQK
ncbi:histidine kinase [Halosquirtibacter laminarini]|uniref:Histidine kinase n=1 Tax=Halosquirtibacter laminarini TaxID=3374600 RepID=A0AC61NNZ6_9BACT|nr:histidine kinase [Prolixibacteraceae bacterium]